MAIQNVTDAYVLAQTAGDTYNGDSSDQTYSINPNLVGAGDTITIIDQGGSNAIELPAGLEITSSQTASDQTILTLSNGAVIDIRGASTFTFNVGQNQAGGDTTGTDLTFEDFATNVLGVTVPAEGDVVDGGGSTVNDDGTADVEGEQSFALTADAADVDEGATATFTLTTDGVSEGTEVAYTITGVDAADVTGDLTGTATVAADGTATISVDVAADEETEGEETLTVTLDDDATATADVTVNDTSLTPGETFVLVADTETLVGTSRDDTFDGSLANSLEGDTIIDQGGTDTLNATLTANLSNATTVTDVENINVDLDVFAGANAAVFADNITGATITGSSSKLGFDGDFVVNNAGDNNVTAGTNVDDLDVDGLEAGTVDAGSASAVAVDTANAADVANVTVNGDVDLTVATATDLALTATAASVISVGSGNLNAVTDITTTGDATLQGDGDEFNGLVITGGAIDVNASGGGGGTILDAEDFDVSGIEVSTADMLTITNADDQSIELTAENADLFVVGSGATGAAVELTVSADQATGPIIGLTGADTSTLTLTTAVEDLFGLFIEGDATVDVAGDTTIANLTATAGTDTVTFTGAGSVDATGSATDVASVDASGLTGGLTYAQAVDGDISVTGGAADDDITLATVAADAEVDTGAGSNTVTVDDLNNGTLAVTGGADDDTVNIGATGNVGAAGAATVAVELGGGDDTVALGDIDGTDASTFALDFGAGTDTLSLTNTDDISGENISVSGLEVIDMNGSAEVAASLVSGESFAVLGGGLADGTLSVTGTDAAGETIDLSSLVLDGTAANAVADTVITGTAGNDVITGTDLVDNMTGGTGEDTFVFLSQSQSTASATDVISDGGGGADFVSGTDTIDLSAVLGGTGSAPASITTAGAALDGTAAEFGGNAVAFHDDGTNTTVYVDVNGDDAFDAADDMQIELIGTGLGLTDSDFLV